MGEKPLVVITGITGYLGSQTCLTFLQDGSYRVRGTVRSMRNKEKLAPLKAVSGELFDQLELVEADLNHETSLIAACAGATYIIHTASPSHLNGGCIAPAVNGTLAAMKAATQNKVRMIVVTSSCAAVLFPGREHAPVPPAKHNESCWSNPDRREGMNDYMKSKTLAEKAVWEYQAAHPGFDVATICPTFIMGPAPYAGDGISARYLKSALNGSQAEIPRGFTALVDVRDVAVAHLRAIQLPEAANKRFILYNEARALKEIYGLLTKFNERGAKVPTKLKKGVDVRGDPVDNTRSKEVLKIEYMPLEKTMTDHAEHLLSMGAIRTSASPPAVHGQTR